MNADHHIKKINQYMFDLTHLIAATPTSKVYRAINTATGDACAIKAITPPKPPTSATQQQQLYNQAKALKETNHPNIIRALDILQTTNNFYIVMPLYGETLEQKARRQGGLSEGEVSKVLLQLAGCLVYMESKGMIHRAITPSNLLTNRDQIVLTDFGHCIFATKSPKDSNCHDLSDYVSPQAYEDGSYSYKSDVWAAAITALELLFGKKPFEGLEYKEMIGRLRTKQYLYSLQISTRLKEILSKMLALEPSNRISAAELKVELNTKSESVLGLESRKQLAPFRSQQNLQLKKEAKPENHQMKSKKDSIICGQAAKIQSLSPRSSQTPSILSPIFLLMIKSLMEDEGLPRNQHKLKLLRLLSKLNRSASCREIESVGDSRDEYFEHVLETACRGNVEEISHFLRFLISKSLEECGKQNENNEQQIAIMKNALHALSPRRPHQQQGGATFFEAIRATSRDHYL